MYSILDEDIFELDPDTDSLKTKNNFLKDIEVGLNIDAEDKNVRDRLEDVKNKLLERVKAASNRFGRLRVSSNASRIDRKGKVPQSLQMNQLN